jgi:hypothetical protein
MAPEKSPDTPITAVCPTATACVAADVGTPVRPVRLVPLMCTDTLALGWLAPCAYTGQAIATVIART